MTRPDPSSPDSGASQDDAVWLDLVARLEGRDPGAGAATSDTGESGAEADAGGGRGATGVDGPQQPSAGTGGSAEAGRMPGAGSPGAGGQGAGGPASGLPASGVPASPRPFSDFDPLGLSAGVPIELSAEERQAQSRAQTQAGGGPAGGDDAGRQEPATGPRDYEGTDEDPFAPDEFVPEEPPSLAGTDPLTLLAWLGAVGGPVALLMSAVFWRGAPLMAILGMVAAFAASLVFLIMKLPGEKDEHDDGARL